VRGRDTVEGNYFVRRVELVWRLGLGGQFRYCGGGVGRGGGVGVRVGGGLGLVGE
jgi:hypothetical protein